MRDIIRVKDQFYVLATSSLADDRTRVLKDGETFAVFDRYGDIQPLGVGEQGLYHGGTRFLSHLVFHLHQKRPFLLSSTVRKNNSLLAVDLTNLDTSSDGEPILPRGTLHIFRSKFLRGGVCYERFRVSNYGPERVEAVFSLEFESDFADIFEVRGRKRKRRGTKRDPLVEDGRILLSYEGLDGVLRSTCIVCSPQPDFTSGSEVRFEVRIEPREEKMFQLAIGCTCNDTRVHWPSYEQAFAQAEQSLQATEGDYCDISSSNEQFNDWLTRSKADLRMMITDTSEGPYPYAGVPWYSTAFGRDGILTALQALWVNPSLAKGVLGYLASTQAESSEPELDAEPGKILHETRQGEMAALGEIPFGRYYGSVDGTPLFVMLAGAYYEGSGDRDFIESIWPNIERALEWIDTCGDLDGDGFVEYSRRCAEGLMNQGWKDSWNSVFHADGRLAEGPIALCEVQGYVYAAKRRAATLATALGKTKRAEELLGEAQILKERFEQVFWCEELSSYAHALDGEKHLCRVRTSNAGQCLFTGIVSPDRARRTAQTLLSDASFGGWGIRTVASTEARYDPMSYHNGSIWPHDNALIAQGLARYGLKELALRVFTALFDASLSVDLHRLPELYCGFHRRPGEGLALYPVSCAPQSWAAVSVFMLLRAILGLSIDAPRAQVRFHRPVLPQFLQDVEIKNLRVGEGSVDLSLHRYEDDVGVNIIRREGPVEVVVLK